MASAKEKPFKQILHALREELDQRQILMMNEQGTPGSVAADSDSGPDVWPRCATEIARLESELPADLLRIYEKDKPDTAHLSPNKPRGNPTHINPKRSR